MQLRENDIILNECPKSMIENPSKEHHSLLAITDTNETLRIPFQLRGVTSTILVTTLTLSEYQELPRIELTSPDLTWDPQNPDYAAQEASFFTVLGQFNPPGDRDSASGDTASGDRSNRTSRNRMIKTPGLGLAGLKALQHRVHSTSYSDAILNSIDPTLTEGSFLQMLQSNRAVTVMSTTTSKRTGLKPEHLASKWNISLKQAENTIRVTTQRAVRLISNPALSRRFKTNDRMLRYNRVQHTVFTDTMKATVLSTRKNRYAQIYCTDFQWMRAYPMRTESEAHYTLSTMMKDVGVPNKMVMDNAKTQVLGQFKRKLREADCRIKRIEPHTPFSNAAEAAIRELKKRTARALTKSKCPKSLWDDCIELTALQRSHTALDLWNLRGEVPQTIMTGQTADISQLFELEWYEWVKYYESATRFPEDKMSLGKYLGPSIDIGPAMTAKILKRNGNTTHVSTYRALTDEEIASDLEAEDRLSFTESIGKKLGPEASMKGLKEEIGDVSTPAFEPYEDRSTPAYSVPDRDEHQAFDQYIGAEVMLPLGDCLKTGKVLKRKVNMDGEAVGKHHSNPLFDTREYVVEFPDGMEAEYTALSLIHI